MLVGPSVRDPWTVPVPLRGPSLDKPIRVVVVVDPAGQGVAEQVRDGVRKAARALEDAGYALEEAEPPSIEIAAKTLLDVLNPDMRVGWPFLAPLARDPTRHS